MKNSIYFSLLAIITISHAHAIVCMGLDNVSEQFVKIMKIIHSTKKGQVPIIKEYISQKPLVVFENRANGNTLLAEAVIIDKPHYVKLLLENKSDPDGYVRSPLSPLHQAQSSIVIDMLLSAGADIEGWSPFNSPLLHSMYQGNFNKARYLLKKGALATPWTCSSFFHNFKIENTLEEYVPFDKTYETCIQEARLIFYLFVTPRMIMVDEESVNQPIL